MRSESTRDGSTRAGRGRRRTDGVGPARSGRPGERRAGGLAAGLLALTAALGALGAPGTAAAQDLDVPYVPTPMPVVEQMLELTGPTAEDSLYDLGSGDGRIVIRAAEKYGTPGVGVELDSGRVARARRNAGDAGVDQRVRFIRGDLFEVDVSPASVVTLYLLSSVNRKLRPKLFEQLRPGTRVVSHDFDMGEWQADSVVKMPDHNSTVYYWVMPARVMGRWTLRPPSGDPVTVEIRQKFQELRATAPGGGVTVESARIRGETVHLRLTGVGSGGTLELEGSVTGGRMSGTAAGGGSWSAQRTAGAGWPVDAWRATEGAGTGTP